MEACINTVEGEDELNSMMHNVLLEYFGELRIGP